MSGIHIVRKVSPVLSRGRIARADKDRLRFVIATVSRVDRPAILNLFLGGDTANDVGSFFDLESASASAVKDPANLVLGRISGWQVPVSDLGRKAEALGQDAATASQAESIRLWVAKHIVGNGICHADEVAVIFVK